MPHPSQPVASAGRPLPELAARRRSLFWRIHFWAALIASPFTLLATLTGIVYILTPQIEARLYGKLDHVAPAGAMLALDTAVAAARAAAPAGLSLQSVQPAHAAGDSVKVVFAPGVKSSGGHEGHSAAASPAVTRQDGPAAAGAALAIFVNPYDGQVLGAQLEQERYSFWARRLHSQLLQGDGWRWLIELAASWLMVMLLTGIYLWWPSTGQPGLPQRGKRDRALWRQWHAFLGVALSVLTLTMVATGITWSKYAGEQVRKLRDVSGQAPPRVPRTLHSMPQEGVLQLDWQSAWLRARALAPDVAMQLTPPRGPHGVWAATATDRAQPGKRFDLVLDSYRGTPLYYSGWDQQTAFGKATAVGIPFHRGEFGWWNQALLFLFAAGVLFSLVSGWVMFFKRRRAGLLGLPKLVPGAWRAVPLPAAVLGLALCALLPLLAASAFVVMLFELAAFRIAPVPAGANR
jgi:uncharacterized iron-regulated membrane protein